MRDLSDCPSVRAYRLFRSILPPKERDRLERRRQVLVYGKHFTYRLIPNERTRIETRARGLVAISCLRLTKPAPEYDRMLAEYLVLRHDEVGYWNTANVFQPPYRFGLTLAEIIGVLLLLGFCAALIFLTLH